MNRRLAIGFLALSLGTALPLEAQDAAQRVTAAERLLSRLIETYGVSGHEEKVRELILSELPGWGRPEVDSAGNIWLRAGKGGPPVVLVAHMDELGYEITSIREDGTLEVSPRGGMFTSLWEGRPALIHTPAGPIPAVFIPRDSAASNTRRPPGALRVDPGAGSKAAAEAMGIKPGQSITSPKEYTRLAGTRATGRSFDDRVGCAALLIALRRLDVAHLRHEVIFVFSVREETGLEGARAVAASLGIRPARVHAIDTFVSSDTPFEPQNYGLAPLGKGPVVRALDNSSATSPAQVDSLVTLVRLAGYTIQTGTTSGGNDGSVFLPYGVPDVPVGWPLRYAHSPAEVIDLRDVVGLSEVVRLIAERW
jgi:putative aminopeptidase